VFTRFHKECIGGVGGYEYKGLVHRAGALFDEADFIDGENAIVDFKYSAKPSPLPITRSRPNKTARPQPRPP
jgi:hypothetical protein